MENQTLEDIVKSIKPEVTRQIEKRVADRVSESLSWTLQDRVASVANAYIEEHVLPDVEKRLRESHDVMVEAICEAVTVGCQGLRDKMVEKLTKNLDRDWAVREAIKKLFE